MIDMLCSAAESEPSEENVSKCEMKHFKNLTAPKLQAFIIARHPTFKTKASISHLKKPRTALKDAEEGKSNLLSVACYSFCIARSKDQRHQSITVNSRSGMVTALVVCC
mmetsp:Transcript_27735/g.66823  ORF Transcript_27735/g.66823 Transcript_27735/m.66823 type:complete len:109 (+) Transcript_27735:830-1156(+)